MWFILFKKHHLKHCSEIIVSIKNNLKKIRTERGLTQKELSEIANIELAQVSRIETGASEPKLESIKKLAIALECSADELIFSVEEKRASDQVKALVMKLERLTPIAKFAALRMIDSYCEYELLHLKIVNDQRDNPEKLQSEYGIGEDEAVWMALDNEEEKFKKEQAEAYDLIRKATNGNVLMVPDDEELENTPGFRGKV